MPGGNAGEVCVAKKSSEPGFAEAGSICEPYQYNHISQHSEI